MSDLFDLPINTSHNNLNTSNQEVLCLDCGASLNSREPLGEQYVDMMDLLDPCEAAFRFHMCF